MKFENMHEVGTAYLNLKKWGSFTNRSFDIYQCELTNSVTVTLNEDEKEILHEAETLTEASEKALIRVVNNDWD